MSSRMRATKGHTRNRRSHHGVAVPRLSKCVKCEGYHLRHRMCDNCGTYRDKDLVDMEAVRDKRLQRAKRKAKSMGLDPDSVQEESK